MLDDVLVLGTVSGRFFDKLIVYFVAQQIVVVTNLADLLSKGEFKMKKFVILIVLMFVMAFSALSVAASDDGYDNSCWGQATAVFAQTGEMGEHASQQPTPRLGLRNLARAFADAGIIPDDSMQSLGAFVANELGLTIEACIE